MAQAFTYSPLDPSSKCIRLLKLLPSSPSETVRCKLHVVDRTCCPSYVALSYTWGSSQNRQLIDLDDMEFHVQGNLWNFLNTMNLCRRWQLFWIDAICIDQSSISERNHQVNMMRDIYAGAELTVVWLGQATDSSDLAIEYIANPGLPAQETKSALEKALQSLLEQPYWSRIWIVQELMLAKDVMLYCGTKSFSWHQLASLRQEIKTHVVYHDSLGISKCTGSVMIAQKMLWDSLPQNDQHLPLSDLLMTYGRHKSSDIRDRVYALLGLTSENSVQANYNLSVEDIYIDVLGVICKERNPRYQLSAIEHTLQEMLCLPKGLRRPRQISGRDPIPADAFAIRVLELRRQKLGKTHPHVLEGMASLVQLYSEQSRPIFRYERRYPSPHRPQHAELIKAGHLGDEVLQLQQKVLGKKHPSTLQSMANLMSIYHWQNRLDEAEKLGNKVLQLQQEVLGEKHPSTLQSMTNLMSNYLQQDKLDEAGTLKDKMLQLQQEVLDERDPSTLQSMVNLISIYCGQGMLDEAQKLQDKVLQLQKEVLGEKHPSTLQSMVNLVSIYCQQRRLDEAGKLGDEVLQLQKEVLGEKHPSTLQSMVKLGSIYGQQGRHMEAIEMLDQVFQNMANLVSVYREQGKLKDAENIWVEVCERIAILVVRYRTRKSKGGKELIHLFLELHGEIFGENHPHFLEGHACMNIRRGTEA
ncbi:TPR-like protein [Aspergillus eucalypticola CBS 122712]|uniref:TPR-like protein n=1 Tax=Aspergillus eucalypticola (strain CBS 122712 / IBT 29274) TaxID=1448314 RepID=A0A317WCE0_ASPEC|nr:TPR-like protein [Aspergillus eucalypticola CBS 122712]PWY84033.1 TPR-like protein [Aspergillus eucalypticola CBS 122712]